MAKPNFSVLLTKKAMLLYAALAVLVASVFGMEGPVCAVLANFVTGVC